MKIEVYLTETGKKLFQFYPEYKKTKNCIIIENVIGIQHFYQGNMVVINKKPTYYKTHIFLRAEYHSFILKE